MRGFLFFSYKPCPQSFQLPASPTRIRGISARPPFEAHPGRNTGTRKIIVRGMNCRKDFMNQSYSSWRMVSMADLG